MRQTLRGPNGPRATMSNARENTANCGARASARWSLESMWGGLAGAVASAAAPPAEVSPPLALLARLGKVTAPARLQRALDHHARVVHRKHDDCDIGLLMGDGAQRLEALAHAHAERHDDDVRRQPLDRGQRFWAVVHRADHAQVVVLLEQAVQPVAHDAVPVGDQRLDWRAFRFHAANRRGAARRLYTVT